MFILNIGRLKDKMNKTKSVSLNAILNSFHTLLNLLFPLITFPYITRTLSVEGVGRYNFAFSIISYFILLSGLGINVYAVREGAKFRDDREKISIFASRIFTISIFSTILSYITLFLLLFFSSELQKYSLPILAFSVQIFFTTLGVEWVYTIFEEYLYITLRNIVFKIISIILLFLFVREPGDYLIYVLISVLASSGSSILNFIYARRFCDIKLVIKFNWKDYLIPILFIFSSTVAMKIYQASDTTMIGLLIDDRTVGIYSVATKIYVIAGGVLLAVSAVTIPRLSMLMGQNRITEYRSLLNKLVNVVFLIIFPGITGLFMISEDIILIIAGESYLQATVALKISCFAIIGSAMSGIFNQCALMPSKRERKTLISSSTSAVLNIGLNLVLIPKFGAVGAAITTVLAEFTMMIMNFYFSKDITGFVFKNKETLKNIFSIVIGCIGIVMVCYFSSAITEKLLIRFSVAIIGSGIIYFALLRVLKNPVALELFDKVSHKLGKS